MIRAVGFGKSTEGPAKEVGLAGGPWALGPEGQPFHACCPGFRGGLRGSLGAVSLAAFYDTWCASGSCWPGCWPCEGALQPGGEDWVGCCTPACAGACRAPTAGPIRWGTGGKACSYARVSTRPEIKPATTDVSETGVRSALMVCWGSGSAGLSIPTQQQYSLVSTVSLTALSHTRCLSQPQGDDLDSISVH